MKVLNNLDSLDFILDGEKRKLPTATSELKNDSGFLTEVKGGLGIKVENNNQISTIPRTFNLAKYILENTPIVQPGSRKSGLIFHGKNDAIGAKDDSYRFAGSKPHNFLFCQGEMYRILGIYPEGIKVIQIQAGSEPMSLSLEEASQTTNSVDLNFYRSWNEEPTTAEERYNYWEKKDAQDNLIKSSINTFLNTEYYNIIPDYLKQKIVPVYWTIGGNYKDDLCQGTFQSRYEKEILSPFVSSDSKYPSKTTNKENIGLLYASDQLFAQSRYSWEDPATAEYMEDLDNFWLEVSGWTMTRIEPKLQSDQTYDVIDKVIRISKYGDCSARLASYEENCHPVFFLNKELINFTVGTGEEQDPYIVGDSRFLSDINNQKIKELNNLLSQKPGEKTWDGGEIFNDITRNLANYNAHAEGQDNYACGDYSHIEGEGSLSYGRVTFQCHIEEEAYCTYTMKCIDTSSYRIDDFNRKVIPYNLFEIFGEANGIKEIEQIDNLTKRVTTTNSYYFNFPLDTEVTVYTQGFALGDCSHVEGGYNKAIGKHSHAEGKYTEAIGYESHSEGDFSKAIGNVSHAEGSSTEAQGDCSHTEGTQTFGIGENSHAEGASYDRDVITQYFGRRSADVQFSIVTQDKCTFTEPVELEPYDFLEIYKESSPGSGRYNRAGSSKVIEKYSSTEYKLSNAVRIFSISPDKFIFFITSPLYALGKASHAEGSNSQAIGNYSHAEGLYTKAIGEGSHAEGGNTKANGMFSHAGGTGTFTEIPNSYIIGQYGKLTTTDNADTLFAIANGSSEYNPHLGLEFKGKQYDGTLFVEGNQVITAKDIASPTSLGVIKVGANLSIDNDGTLNAIVSGGGGSSGGGTSDYSVLSNKPQINNVVLKGNKTLDDLGIQSKGNYLTSEEDPTVPSYVKNLTQDQITKWDAEVGGKELANKKQDALTPGVNISIVNGIISATDTTNYSALINKPKINNQELDGNISLETLGIQPKGVYLESETDPTVPKYIKDITSDQIAKWDNEVGGKEIAANKQNTLTPGANISIKNNVISAIDTNTTNYTELTNKPKINSIELSGNKTLDDLSIQHKLTAGSNVTIEGNIISTTIKDGQDGYTPIKGVDYFTTEEQDQFKNDIIAAIGATQVYRTGTGAPSNSLGQEGDLYFDIGG